MFEELSTPHARSFSTSALLERTPIADDDIGRERDLLARLDRLGDDGAVRQLEHLVAEHGLDAGCLGILEVELVLEQRDERALLHLDLRDVVAERGEHMRRLQTRLTAAEHDHLLAADLRPLENVAAGTDDVVTVCAGDGRDDSYEPTAAITA